MRKSVITAEFNADLQTVWAIVTDNTCTAWRSDLEKVEISRSGNEFTEYTKGGFTTRFTIQKKIANKQYEFAMENKNFKGYWTGSFSQTASGGTRIVFTEQVQFHNPVMGLLSYLFVNLKKMQQTYVRDLKQKLGE